MERSPITPGPSLERDREKEQENVMSNNAMGCYGRMLRHKPSACDLTPSDSLILTLEQVSLAVDVLSEMSTYAISDPVTQALMIFLKMKDDLTTCRESVEYNEPASPQLKPWLHHLQHFQESASSDCVQDAVMLNLIPLREDVKCWALSQ
ncbi:interferon lambda-3-like [Aquarana catesbeiana]|uniref:interferon lambda-3-like n=1 Tax=Aquarana catesbeiana TaxID=8400 RepID=UPI003CCA0DC1